MCKFRRNYFAIMIIFQVKEILFQKQNYKTIASKLLFTNFAEPNFAEEPENAKKNSSKMCIYKTMSAHETVMLIKIRDFLYKQLLYKKLN